MEQSMIKTPRLKMYPATREQMEATIASEKTEELKAAYTQMLEESLRHPQAWEWYALWFIEKKDGTHIGDFCFKGLTPEGKAEIGYGILPPYENQGYGTEAVKGALSWAFGDPHVTAIEAETDPDNSPSQRVLEKCGFVPTGERGEEGPRYIIPNPSKLSHRA